ncbi:hypothetical protein Tco_1112620 [Tanacetum coccineum]|uniref:Uncharacterized protein n=1 Tax=Tanacetum coccineum TaxID=301880 RepID=A0ABQ5IS77_9ASTR
MNEELGLNSSQQHVGNVEHNDDDSDSDLDDIFVYDSESEESETTSVDHLSDGITPQDCIIRATTQSEIALSQSQPVESQEEEPRQQQPSQQQPRQQKPRRTSERIAQIMFNKPLSPGPRSR